MGIGGAARRIATAAAYGGGGITALGGAVYGLFRVQAGIAMRTVGPTDLRTPPDATGWYGLRHPGPTIEVALLGDSIVAGYGVETIEETVGAHLATSLTRRSQRRVHLTQFGVVGARSIDLGEQLDRAIPTAPHVAVLLIGANDVTKTQRPAVAVRALAEAVRRLREAGIAVIVGTCPDLGTIEPIPTPLRQMARKWSRSLAAAQSIAVVEAGGRSVSIGDILGPEFEASPTTMFGPDRFHPSSEGYWRLAEVLSPSVLASVDGAESEVDPRAHRGEGVLPVASAAAQAAEVGGTELGGVEVDGSQRGERGRWALLRRRDRTPEADSEHPEATETDA